MLPLFPLQAPVLTAGVPVIFGLWPILGLASQI